MKVKVINRSGFELPKYETENSFGMDVKAVFEKDSVFGDGFLVLTPKRRALIKTGLFVEIPKGEEIQVRPRSGLALKYGVTVLNSPGTIDADYRGEIGVILINHGDADFVINHGDRIAQIIGSKKIEWESAEELSETDRGDGGFGSTGK